MTIPAERMREITSFEDAIRLAESLYGSVDTAAVLSDPRDERVLKSIRSAPTDELRRKAEQIYHITYAAEIVGNPVTILDAWAHPSDYADQDYSSYAYVLASTASGEILVCIGGNAGSQALTYARLGRLPSKRILTVKTVNDQPLYVWRRAAK